MRIKIFFALVVALATPSVAHATQYIVDGSNPSAADTNPGTAAQPFKTISAAVAQFKAGDTVMVKGGIYHEAVEIKTSGTPGKPLTLEAAPGESVILDEADVVKGWEKYDDKSGRPLWKKSPWPKGRVFPIAKSDWSERMQLLADNLQFTQVEHMEQLSPGSFYFDPAANGTVYLWPMPPRSGTVKIAPNAQWWDNPVNLASDDPNDHQVEIATRDAGLQAFGQSYLNIRGLTIRHGAGALGILLGGDDNPDKYVTLENCTVEYAYAAISVRGDHFQIRHCYFHDNGLGSGGGLTNSVMEDTVFDHNTAYGTSHGFSAGGIKFLWTVNTTIRRCQFINNNGPGIWFDTGNANNIIEQNFCSYNSGSGIMMEVSPDFGTDKLDAKPIIDGWAARYMGVKEGGPAGPNIIRNNICNGNRWDGVTGDGILLQLASDEIVVNNTLVGNAQYGIFGRYHPYAGGEHRIQDNVILNNLCVDNESSQIYITPDPVDRPGIVARNRSDYNLFWDTRSWQNRNEDTGIRDYDGDRTDYGRWGKTENDLTYSIEETFKIRGFEEHSLQAEPFFISPTNLDFGLQANSPAIGAGTTTAYVLDDYLGHKRPDGRPPSIGALEYFPGLQEPPTMPMRGASEAHQ